MMNYDNYGIGKLYEIVAWQAMLEDEHPDWLDPVTRFPLSSMEPLEEYEEDCENAPEEIQKEIDENRRAWANCKDSTEMYRIRPNLLHLLHSLPPFFCWFCLQTLCRMPCWSTSPPWQMIQIFLGWKSTREKERTLGKQRG